MAVLISKSKDPYYNLATEEFLLKSADYNEDILFIWRAEKAFVFGRNQNPFIEIAPKYYNQGIPIIRRLSGGGTVYIDSQTINFSYITLDYKNKINNYEYFLEPIIKLLGKYNLNILFKPKSHLFLNGKKISGNAQGLINNKLLHHGTLLFNTDLDLIQDALINHNLKTEGHHVLSNKQNVDNLKHYLNDSLGIEDLIVLLIDSICYERNINKEIKEISKMESRHIEVIAEEKYRTWEWNFGFLKEFQIEIEVAKQEVGIIVNKGIITNVQNSILNSLIGLKLYSEDYFNIIEKLNV